MKAYVSVVASYPALADRHADSPGCVRCAPSTDDPPCIDVLPARMRRGLSAHQRSVVDVLANLLGEPHDRESVPIVHGSAFGELETAVQLATMPLVTPARFTLSVHSAAIGLVSIAFRNPRGHTTLSGGADTLVLCLVEAFGRLLEGEPEVVVVVADETSASFVDGPSQGFAYGLRLRRDPTPTSRPIEFVSTGRLPQHETPMLSGDAYPLVAAFDHALRCVREESVVEPTSAAHPSIRITARRPT